MELTGLKNIQNTGEVNEENLPGYKDGFFKKVGTFFGNIGKGIGSAAKDTGEFIEGDNKLFGTNGAAMATGAMGVVDMVGQIGAAGKFNRTADDLLQDAGKSQNNIGGVGYTVQNDIDRNQIEKETGAEATSNTIGLTTKGASTGAAIGSLAGPVGTVVGGAIGAVGGIIGGLFGGGAKKREMKKQLRLAEIKRINTNDFNRSGALTTVLLNDLAETEGDQTQQTLYAAADGKLPGFTNGFVPNCKLSNGEHVILHDPIGNPVADIPVGRGRDNKDTVKAFIPKNASVITNKNGATEYLERTGDINGAEYLTAMNILNKKYKNGKLPGFVNGLPELINSFVNLGGAVLAGSDASRMRNLAISNPDFRENLQNRSRIDAAMLSRHENPYPIMEQYYNSLAKQKYNLRNTYGLSQAQRAMMDASAEQQARESMGRLLTEQQRSNNAMIADAARLMAQEDATLAELNFNANKAGYDAYNQSHGAREMMASQRLADMMNFAEQWTKGLTDMHMWRNQMGLWLSEVDSKKAELYLKAGLSPWGTKLAEKPTDVDMYNYINNIQPTVSDEYNAFRDSYFATQPKKLGPIAQDAADRKAYEDKISNIVTPDLSYFDNLISQKIKKNRVYTRRKSSKKK